MNAEQIKEALSDFAIELLSQIEPVQEPEIVTLQSIIGMIHTLISDGRIFELDKALQSHFPEYYVISGDEQEVANYLKENKDLQEDFERFLSGKAK